MKKEKILIFIAHYLPGYKIGGPLNSVLNITKNLKVDYDFYIITSDRDMGDSKKYENVQIHKWINVDGVNVMYFEPGFKYYFNIYKHLKRNSYNFVYLNSIFEFKFSIFVVFLNYLKINKLDNIIIAPRGELFEEALFFGKFKKHCFLKTTKLLGIYKSIVWHSTADIETETIIQNISKPRIKIARVIADTSYELHNIEEPEFISNEINVLKIIFLSRISKEKNLIYALKILKEVSCFVEFHIYGPIEDIKIWNECVDEIKLMPSNVIVKYKGNVEKKFVKTHFSKYDLFLFPTHLENYGHVINEALSVGTPVLLSDNTPWRALERIGLGWDFNLTNKQSFIDTIQCYANKNLNEKLIFRNGVLKSYSEQVNLGDLVKENINLFKI
nr:glycosyltransferase [uncultured Flavobacterium sp.]